MNKTRTKIRLPKKQYTIIKSLSAMIGKPVATTLSMIICDTIDALLYNDIVIDSPTKRRTWLTDNTDKIKWTGINFSIRTEFYDKILDYIHEAKENGLKNYSFNEFVIDCINLQVDDFKNILNNKTSAFITDLRIANARGASYNRVIYNGDNHKEQLYSDEILEKHKVIPPINDFLKNKSKQYGITEGALLTFYATKEINRLLNNESQREIFKHEYTEYDEHGI